ECDVYILEVIVVLQEFDGVFFTTERVFRTGTSG
ncbi:hypothetical protein EVA_17449, partial [gut metagenome]